MRVLLFIAGWCFVALGIIGAFLPLLPTVPFLILALACFARSSPRFYNWLLNHPVWGEPIRQWQRYRSIPRKAKYIAVTSVICSGAISLYILDNPILRLAVVVFLTIPIVIISRIPTREDAVSIPPATKQAE